MSEQECRQCGEEKALEGFERLASGGHRGTCKACRRAASAELKRQARHSPEHLAEVARRAEEREAESASKRALKCAQIDAERAQKEAELAEEKARQEAEAVAALERAEATRQSRKDAIWGAMWAERERRAAAGEVVPEPQGIRTMRLDSGGYISIAEFAKRVEERKAVQRQLRNGLREEPQVAEERSEPWQEEPEMLECGPVT